MQRLEKDTDWSTHRVTGLSRSKGVTRLSELVHDSDLAFIIDCLNRAVGGVASARNISVVSQRWVSGDHGSDHSHEECLKLERDHFFVRREESMCSEREGENERGGRAVGMEDFSQALRKWLYICRKPSQCFHPILIRKREGVYTFKVSGVPLLR